ncbi:MAG: glutaredoxin family protein [archaeon GB-1867-005]|nr:glutaredoxin family protein [Candidatus Culexmicrobium cathedralense]
MSSFKVILYTTPRCPRCLIVKSWLKSRNIPFEERDLSDPDVMAELVMRDVFIMSAPILEVNGNFYSEEELFNGDSLNEALLSKLVES